MDFCWKLNVKPPRRRAMVRAWSLPLLALLGVIIVQTPAVGEDVPRWSEAGYGVSLTPPANTAQIEGSAVTWLDPRGFTISFEIVGSDVPVSLETMTATALVQMGFAQATPRMLDAAGQPSDKPPIPERLGTPPGDRPGIRMYFELDQQDKPDWFYELSNLDKNSQQSFFYGQAIVMLDPYAAVVVKLTAVRDAQAAGQKAFEQVVASLNVPMPEELEAMRSERVDRADQWLQTTTPQGWADALPTDQWYRLIQAGQDVGHVRVRSSRDPADLRRFDREPPGTLLVIDRRDYLAGQVLDSRSVLYDHDDPRRELWETKTTLRSAPGMAPGITPGIAPGNGQAPLNQRDDGRAVTWVETGVRGNQEVTRRDADGQRVKRIANLITVIAEAPPATAAVQQIEAHERFIGKAPGTAVSGRVNANEWVAPDRSYLSQLRVWALGAVLPAEPGVYCFSAYHPASGQPGLRTVEVQPQPDGTLVVLDRPTSRLSPTRSVYDADRKLLERTTPQGLRMIPTTPDELAKVWGVQLESR